ncbi:MAG: P1 family peptidase [Gaiellaceae bacterium]
MSGELPGGFRVGHWSDHEGWTGCTVVLAPEGAVGACEVRGGGPGTRESDLLSPAAAAPGPDAVLLTGGSAFGLVAAGGVVRWLAERERGFRTRAGVVPLVAGAVVFDLGLGDSQARPDDAAGYSACEAASAQEPERGSVGVGTGCTVGKLLGPDGWTKGGVGYTSASLPGGAAVAALAAVNAFGDVLAEDGSVLAGVRRGGTYARTTDVLAAGETLAHPWNESTTLVCVLTDATLTKTQAWLVARAAGSGVARAVDPCATVVDGDVVYCVASGHMKADLVTLSAHAARTVAVAVRDAVRQATSAPGCPAAAEARAESR